MFSNRQHGEGGGDVLRCPRGAEALTGTHASARAASSAHRLLTTVAALSLLAAACTGTVGGSSDPGGSNEPGGNGNSGNGNGNSGNGNGGNGNGGNGSGNGGGGIPAPPPEDAPVTGAFASAPGPSSRFVRLTHKQWENTVNDLFKGTTPRGLSGEFLSEPIRSSFNNNGGILDVSAALWNDYQKAAERLAGEAAKPNVHGAFLNNGAKDAKTFIRNFGLKAYRRPLTDAEVSQYEQLFAKGGQAIGGADAFADGVALVVEAMLQSPHFLYRAELSSQASNGRVKLSGFEVASRLSYGITNSMPDEQLFAAAMGNKLGSRDEVVNQARRLLESEKGKEMLRDLHEQAFKMKEFAEVKRDASLFPEFRAEMGPDMKTEALTFLEQTVFADGKGVTEMLTAPYTYANARLAPLYGKSLPAGQNAFVKLDLDPQQRAGFYTQLGFLASTATDQAPRSIIRGVHLSLDALCVELPAPPDVPPQAPDTAGKTNRQMLEAFTESPGSVCAGCHSALINPLGFAMENFDGLGKYRTQERNGLPIDARSKYGLAEGEKSFNGAVELMKAIAAGKQAHECYAQHLFEYIYGRERARAEDAEVGALAAADANVIKEIGRRSRLKVPVKNMILDLVSTDAFLTRLP